MQDTISEWTLRMKPRLTREDQQIALRQIRREQLAAYLIVKALLPLPPFKREAILQMLASDESA